MKKIILLSLVALFSTVAFAQEVDCECHNRQCSIVIPEEGLLITFPEGEIPSGYSNGLHISVDGQRDYSDQIVLEWISRDRATLFIPYYPSPAHIEVYLLGGGGGGQHLLFDACVCPPIVE